MADVHTREQRSYNMSRIRAGNTKPEILLRKRLRAEGFRNYRIHSKLLGKPDIVFPKKRVIVFVDGCFWHRCPKCFVKPETRADFWVKKINGNVKRDKQITRKLRADGWTIIRFWEHEVVGNVGRCCRSVISELKRK